MMKRLLFFKSCLVLLLALYATSQASATVTVNSTNFPDANFRAAVAQAAGVSENGGTFAESSLTSLDVSGRSITNLKGLELLTGLTYLNVSDNSTLTTGADLTGLTALTTLKASDCNLVALNGTTGVHSSKSYTGAGIILDSGNSGLEYLDISHNDYFYVSGNLQYLSGLKTLLVNDCAYYDLWGYLPGNGMTSLEWVDVSNCPIMDRIYLRGATQLKHLEANGTKVTGFSTSPSNTATSANFVVLSNNSPVEYINIGNCAVTVAGLNGITTYGVASLDTLKVNDNALNGPASSIKSLTALRYLDMSNTGQPQSSTIGAYTAVNNKLETLILKDNSSFGWSASFQYLRKLKYLDISGCDIYFYNKNTSGAYRLLYYLTPDNNPDLETLLVSNSKMGSSTEGLTGFDNLKTVDVSGNAGAAHFWVNGSPLLESLDISGNTGMTYLQLNDDGLPRNNFTLIGAELCPSLNSVYLNGNNYGSVADATSDFASIGTLEFLYLENNSGFNGGALTMTAADCGTLKGIDLGNNGFTSFSAPSLPSTLTALMLGDNPGLTRLEMHNNPGITTMTNNPVMSDGSGLYLLGNTALTYMDISGTADQPNYFQRIGNNFSLQGVPIDTLKASHNQFYTFRNLNTVAGNVVEHSNGNGNDYYMKPGTDKISSYKYAAYWPTMEACPDSASVEQLTALVYLDLSHNNLKDSVYLHKNTALTYLDVSHNRTIARSSTTINKGWEYRAHPADGTSEKRSFPDYKKYLWVANTNKTDYQEAFDQEYYTRDYNDTTGLYILDLMDNNNLEYLDISYTGIQQTALTHCHVSLARYIWIQDLPKLKYFYVDYNGMRSLGVSTKNGKKYQKGLESLERLSAIGMRGGDNITMHGSINLHGDVCTKLHYVNFSYSDYDSISGGSKALGTAALKLDTLIIKGNPIHYLTVQDFDSITYVDARECAFKMRGYDPETGETHPLDVDLYKNGARDGGWYIASNTNDYPSNDPIYPVKSPFSGLRAVRAYNRPKLTTLLLDSCNALTEVYAHHDPMLPKINGFEHLAYPKPDVDSRYGYRTDVDSLTLVWVNDNAIFNELNLTQNVNLRYLHAYNDHTLGDTLGVNGMQLTENVILNTAWVSNSNLQAFSNNAGANLDTLYIWTNPKLDYLDVTGNTGLKWFDLRNCHIRELDVSKCGQLIQFDCSNDSIKGMTPNVWGTNIPNAVPRTLDEIGKNSITDLHFSSHSLQRVQADNNDLYCITGLANNPSLDTLTYTYNHINAIDLTNTGSKLLNPIFYKHEHNGRGTFVGELAEWLEKDPSTNEAVTAHLYYLQLDSLANDGLIVNGKRNDTFLGNKAGQDTLENIHADRVLSLDGFISTKVDTFFVNSSGPHQGNKVVNSAPRRTTVEYGADSQPNADKMIGKMVFLDKYDIQIPEGEEEKYYIEYKYLDGRTPTSTSTYYLLWQAPGIPTEVEETIDDDLGEPTVVSERYYDISGAEHSEPIKGINIIVRQMSDGSQQTVKVMK